jgi:hypothetical protein
VNYDAGAVNRNRYFLQSVQTGEKIDAGRVCVALFNAVATEHQAHMVMDEQEKEVSASLQKGIEVTAARCVR